MLRKYAIYLSLKETCDVYFSSTYSSFNEAKNHIDSFLENYAKKRGKKTIMVSKEELEKLKHQKTFEDCLYIRRKNSEAVVYYVNILEGRFYNSYSIEKFGKVGVNEFTFSQDTNLTIDEEKTADLHVTNYERGTHVSFVSELKNVLNNRKNITFEILKEEKKEDNPFISSLVEGKGKLKNITVLKKDFSIKQ